MSDSTPSPKWLTDVQSRLNLEELFTPKELWQQILAVKSSVISRFGKDGKDGERVLEDFAKKNALNLDSYIAELFRPRRTAVCLHTQDGFCTNIHCSFNHGPELMMRQCKHGYNCRGQQSYCKFLHENTLQYRFRFVVDELFYRASQSRLAKQALMDACKQEANLANLRKIVHNNHVLIAAQIPMDPMHTEEILNMTQRDLVQKRAQQEQQLRELKEEADSAKVWDIVKQVCPNFVLRPFLNRSEAKSFDEQFDKLVSNCTPIEMQAISDKLYDVLEKLTNQSKRAVQSKLFDFFKKDEKEFFNIVRKLTPKLESQQCEYEKMKKLVDELDEKAKRVAEKSQAVHDAAAARSAPAKIDPTLETLEKELMELFDSESEDEENPADPADPVNPANPADPVNPANPADPTDPVNPAIPADLASAAEGWQFKRAKTRGAQKTQKTRGKSSWADLSGC